MQLASAAVLIAVGMLDQALTFASRVGEPNAATRFLPNTGYYLLGWVLRDVVPGRRGLTPTALACATSVAASRVSRRCRTSGRSAGTPTPTCPPVVVASVTGYLLLHAVLVTRCTWQKRAAPLAFGVFLVHVALLSSVRRVTGEPDDLAGVALTAVVVTGALTGASAALTWALLHVPVCAVLGEPARAGNASTNREGPSVTGQTARAVDSHG